MIISKNPTKKSDFAPYFYSLRLGILSHEKKAIVLKKQRRLKSDEKNS
jgi:hypothetical protein